MTRLTLLKLGGELLDSDTQAASAATRVRLLADAGPCVVVHGGGKEIDAESARRGLAKRAVDGLRVTDAATLAAVVAALAGTINTRLVAALVAAGVPAVGLTGADAGCVRVRRAAPYRTPAGDEVDLGLVGEPVADAPCTLLVDLLDRGYVPVVACLGIDAAGAVNNVNADTLAAHLATRLGASRLLIAGTTRGVLDRAGTTIEVLTHGAIDALVHDGTASAGMVAKLASARAAVDGGVPDVAIVDGRAPVLSAEYGTRIAR